MLGEQTRAEEESRAFSSISRRMGKKILKLTDVSVRRGDKQIFSGFNLEFVKGQRFGVIGENGSGKSTLLEILTGNLVPDSGEVDTGVNTVFGYYDQMSMHLPLDKSPLEYLSEIGEQIVLSSDYVVTPARFLELFGFPSSFHRLPIRVLSGGERRRLYLLSTLVKNPNFLVLDEPTNDLDIDTLRRLEQYILDFNGCVISVSHDRAFLDRTCTELIVMPQAVRFEGNYSDYHAQQLAVKNSGSKVEEDRKSYKVEQKTGNQSSSQSGSQSGKQKKGLSFKEQREFEVLMMTIEELETEKSELEDFFSSGQIDTDGSKQKRYREVTDSLESGYIRWEELAERAES